MGEPKEEETPEPQLPINNDSEKINKKLTKKNGLKKKNSKKV